MKLSNTVVSVIIIVAVLVSAYALGLLIRHARAGRTQVQAPGDVNGAVRATPVVSRGLGEGRTKDTPEERAKIRDQRAQAIEEMNAKTPEEKQKFREKIRKQVGGRQPGKGPKDIPSARQGKKPQEQSQADPGGPNTDAGAPVPPGGSTITEPSAEKAGTESDKAGPG